MIEDYMFTSAVFTEVDPKALEKILKVLESHIRVIEKWRGKDFNFTTSVDFGSEVKIGEKIFTLVECHITRWGNFSMYLENEELLLRISDHWSSGSDVRNCQLKTCNWKLHTKTNSVRVFKKHRVQGGFCKKRTLLASKE